MKCFKHSDVEAVGLCEICQKGLCKECAALTSSGITCRGQCSEQAPPPVEETSSEAREPRKRKWFFWFGLLSLLVVLVFVLLGVKKGHEEFHAEEVKANTMEVGRELAARGAQEILRVMVESIASGRMTPEDFFDEDYEAIPNSDPPKFHTRFDAFFDAKIQETIDTYLQNDRVVFAAPVDRNGYLPTHNTRFSQPLTGDAVKDRLSNRTKRIFNDTTGLAAARYDGADGQGVLMQVYQRDTGMLMVDCSAPITLDGRHWGAFRVGMELR
ncbi:MAG: hypothetical protein C0616_03480 [Desulfuromonas sp.]|nr:MAG: hypothetical protein C0616_03480 [Desulfuromonas sp.]